VPRPGKPRRLFPTRISHPLESILELTAEDVHELLFPLRTSASSAVKDRFEIVS